MIPNLAIFFALILYSNCTNIFTKIEIDKGSMTSLNTSVNETTFFYITLEKSDIAGIIYFHITDNNYNLKFNNIQTCYTTREAELDSTIAHCDGDWKDLTPYEKIEDSNPKEYFYKHAYIPHIDSRYLIVKYAGENEDGELKAEGSLTDLYEKLKKIVKKALSVLAIIGIVIGSLIGGFLVLGCICATVLSCINKDKTQEGKTENADSTPVIEIPTKGDEPLTSQTQEENVENTDSKQTMEITDKPEEPVNIQNSEEAQN